MNVLAVCPPGQTIAAENAVVEEDDNVRESSSDQDDEFPRQAVVVRRVVDVGGPGLPIVTKGPEVDVPSILVRRMWRKWPTALPADVADRDRKRVRLGPLRGNRLDGENRRRAAELIGATRFTVERGEAAAALRQHGVHGGRAGRRQCDREGHGSQE